MVKQKSHDVNVRTGEVFEYEIEAEEGILIPEEKGIDFKKLKAVLKAKSIITKDSDIE